MSTEMPRFGLFCSTPAPLTVELIACAGYDFILIDLEHTLISGEQLQAMLLAARAWQLEAWVRIAAPHQAQQVLDAGATCVVFPRIRTREEALQAVALCRHGPGNRRGLNSHWGNRFGAAPLGQSLDDVEAATRVVLMIEDQPGLEQLDAIASCPGVTGLLAGAADLSQDLGQPWQTRHPQVQQAEQAIFDACQQHQRDFIALPRAPEDLPLWQQQGARYFLLGDDRGLARRAFSQQLNPFKETL